MATLTRDALIKAINTAPYGPGDGPATHAVNVICSLARIVPMEVTPAMVRALDLHYESQESPSSLHDMGAIDAAIKAGELR